jgi:phosphatidylserine/phosphatidylglycerophosphate/cardiolipin synthase-like enzyme
MMPHTRWRLAAIALLGLAGCPSAPPATESFEQWESGLVSDGGAVGAEFYSLVAEAQTSIDAAFAEFDDTDGALALLAAAQRGVRVRVVGDADRAQEAGFARLVQGGIEPVFGNPATDWSPSPGVVVRRAGDDNRMTHNFVVVDGRSVLAASTGPSVARASAAHVWARFDSVDVAKDFGDVFDQMHGGVFATSVTRYGANVSADTNTRTRIPMSDGSVSSVWFAPQEGLVKEVIDGVYSARASVLLATRSFENENLLRALRYKAQAGFEVHVVVDSAGADTEGSRVADLEAILAPLAAAGAPVSVTRRAGVGFDAAVFDSRASPVSGDSYDARLLVLSLPFVRSVPFEETPTGTQPVAAETFFDGHMWGVHEQASRQHPTLRAVESWILDASR